MADWNCANLKIVNLYDCEIEKIRSLELPSLEDINLFWNKIKDISPMAGWKCPNLKIVDLHNCGIE